MMPLLADSADAVRSIFFWLVIAVFLLLGMAVVIFLVRKRLSPDEDFRGEGFTLADLRQLHKSGQMTDEEFERAKAQLLKGLQPRQTEAQAEDKPQKPV
jgi:uncharacterized membrane protein